MSLILAWAWAKSRLALARRPSKAAQEKFTPKLRSGKPAIVVAHAVGGGANRAERIGHLAHDGGKAVGRREGEIAEVEEHAQLRQQVGTGDANAGVPGARGKFRRTHRGPERVRGGVDGGAFGERAHRLGIKHRGEQHRLADGNVEETPHFEQGHVTIGDGLQGERLEVGAFHARAQHVKACCPPGGEELLGLRDAAIGEREVLRLQFGDRASGTTR